MKIADRTHSKQACSLKERTRLRSMGEHNDCCNKLSNQQAGLVNIFFTSTLKVCVALCLWFETTSISGFEVDNSKVISLLKSSKEDYYMPCIIIISCIWLSCIELIISKRDTFNERKLSWNPVTKRLNYGELFKM